MKRKDIAESKFWISVNYSFNVIQIATYCEHITGGVNICLYGLCSAYWPSEYAVWIFSLKQWLTGEKEGKIEV